MEENHGQREAYLRREEGALCCKSKGTEGGDREISGYSGC